jgi:hypothetical protein
VTDSATPSWTTPDPRRPLAALPATRAPYDLPVETRPSVLADGVAGLVTVVVTVLVGAPVGLLWAALAPRVDVVVAGADVQLVDPGSSGFIAGDAAFLAAALVAGLVAGIVAWRLGREHGPAVVVGLAVGGLIASYVAMQVGQQVGLDEVRSAVEGGQQGRLELSLRLRAQEALVAWPVGGLLGYLGASLVRGR